MAAILRDPECEMCGTRKVGLRISLLAPSEWSCDFCTWINNAGTGSGAAAVGSSQPPQAPQQQQPPPPPQQPAPDGSWACGVCTFHNGEITLACLVCGTPRPQERSPIGAVLEEQPDDPQLPADLAQDPYSLPYVAPEAPALAPGYVGRVAERLLKHKTDSGQLLAVTPHVVAAFEAYVREEMMLGSFALPDDWLFRTPPTTVDKAIDRIIRGQNLIREVYALHLKEEKLMSTTPCQRCRRFNSQAFLLNPLVCPHPHCIACYRSYVQDLIAGDKCTSVRCPAPGCAKELPIDVIQRVLSAEQWRQFEELALNGMLKADPNTRLLHCPNPKCNGVMSIAQAEAMLVPDKIAETDDMGQPLSAEAWDHFNRHRVRCPECNLNFCADCNLSPYHKGFTCEGLRHHMEARKCRFCVRELPVLDEKRMQQLGRSPAFYSVCEDDDECQEKLAACCPEVLACGHPCVAALGHGPNGHACLECEDAAGRGPPPDELCSICFVEELQAAPVDRLRCGHVFHHACLQEKIERRWPGRRITFGFMQCPTCKREIDCPSLTKELEEVRVLRKEVLRRALERLPIEGLDKDPKLTTPDSQFYGKPEEFAMSSFAFYPCFKCGKVYFGGRRNCEANADAERAPADEFVCLDCAEVKIVPCSRGHPREFQVHMCRFCCQLAVWFCWGTTHFCERCHNQAGSNQVYPCPGPQACPLKGKHPPNSKDVSGEFSLGCGLCRQMLQ